MIRRIIVLSFVVFLVLLAVIAFKTSQYKPQAVGSAKAFALGADIAVATENLSQAVQFKTVSTDLSHPDFQRFLAWIEATYPQTHASLQRVVLEPATPVFKWQGSNPDLKPVLLAAHYDVVPVTPGSRDQWQHAPFAGAIADGFVWGRGTLDNKGAVIAILETVEKMLADGFTPERTIYLSFGGDEEVGGKGAVAVSQHLIEQGVRLAWVLDEGSFVLDGIIPGLEIPVASINLSEKGILTLTLVAEGEGGHSSMPPQMTAVGRLARAVDRLQNAPVPGGLTGVSEEFFDALGRHFTVEKRAIFANRWLFSPVLENILSASPATNAMLRTTTAPTMLSGSNKVNVLPTRATATVNFRLHPRDSVDSVVAHVRAAIDDDGIGIEFNREAAVSASPVSDAKAQGYADIERSILSVFGPIASVPGLTIAATDARHYAKAADAAYRINPFKIEGHDLERFHGINERLSIENLRRGIDFYGSLIRKQ